MKFKLILIVLLQVLSIGFVYAGDGSPGSPVDCWEQSNAGDRTIKVTLYNDAGHVLHLVLIVDHFEVKHAHAKVGKDWHDGYSFFRIGPFNSDFNYDHQTDWGVDHALYYDLESGRNVELEAGSPACERGEPNFNPDADGRMAFRIFGLDGTALYLTNDNWHYGSLPGDVVREVSLERGSPTKLIARSPARDSDRPYNPCQANETPSGPICISNSVDQWPSWDSHTYFTIYMRAQTNQSAPATLNQFRTQLNNY